MSATTEERKKYFDVAPMEALANDVLNSFKLKLSPEIQAQFDKVKAECPDMNLVENFAPLKWTVSQTTDNHNEQVKLEKEI